MILPKIAAVVSNTGREVHHVAVRRGATAGQRKAGAMNTTARSIVSATLLGLATLGTSACTSVDSSAITPSASTTTLMQGWEHWFKLEWSTDREPGGDTTNEYGEAAEPLRLLGQALDASGAIAGQQIVWVPEGVGGYGRAYFEIRHLPTTDHYRVSVWDYSRQQAKLETEAP